MGALSTSMDPPGEPVISTWTRSCQQIQNGSEFPELVAQNSRNPQLFLSNIFLQRKDKRVVHNATALEAVVRPLETVATLQRFGNRRQASRFRGDSNTW